jgi:hypothetical protein
MISSRARATLKGARYMLWAIINHPDLIACYRHGRALQFYVAVARIALNRIGASWPISVWARQSLARIRFEKRGIA